ncbi:MAG: hypothetical protein JNJ46_17265 [Myxococcales bacterium]|nr:hypothetical protein [Myxococcales bacterium]
MKFFFEVPNVQIWPKPKTSPSVPVAHGLTHAGDGADPVPLAGTGHKAGLMTDEQAKKLASLSSSTAPHGQDRGEVCCFPARPANPSPDDDEFEDGTDGFLAKWQRVQWSPSPSSADRGASFTLPPQEWRLEGAKRPSWIQIQPPADSNVGFFTKALHQVAPPKAFVVWSISLDHNTDPVGGRGWVCGWGETSASPPIAPIDGDNMVFVRVLRIGTELTELELSINEGGVGQSAGILQTSLPVRFVGILKDALDYTGFVSSDGVSWRAIGKVYGAITPDRMTVGLLSPTVENDLFGHDFFRVYPDATV